jgi:nicotinamidase-related amidase
MSTTPNTMTKKNALLLIDLQRDFALKNGSLYVNDAESAVAISMDRYNTGNYDLVVISYDNHGPKHCSFASNNGADIFSSKVIPTPNSVPVANGVHKGHNTVLQTMWPDHCVNGSDGAMLHHAVILDRPDIPVLKVYKGQHDDIDSYSAFGDEFEGQFEKTPLHTMLQDHDITHLDIAGLALDYCVAYTALDARRLGYHTAIYEPGTRAVDLNKFNAENGMRSKLLASGVVMAQTSAELNA